MKKLKYIEKDMNTEKNPSTKNKPKWTDILSSISNILMVLVSLGGLYLVLQELENVREQNKYLNRSLMQSYRPLGVFKPKDKDNKTIYVSFIETSNENKISFSYEQDFYNKGEGILFLTGYIYFISDKHINFRKSFLNNEIFNAIIDEFFPYTRNCPLNKNEKEIISTLFTNINLKKTYYLYILTFYKDQDQNLYDTQQLTVLSVLNPIKSEKGFLGRLDRNSGGALHESYHLYKPEERELLIKQLRKFNFSIWNYLYYEE